jgi:hypothetical protein
VLIRLVYLFMVRVPGWLALLVMADAAAVTRTRSGKSRTSGRTDAWFLATSSAS